MVLVFVLVLRCVVWVLVLAKGLIYIAWYEDCRVNNALIQFVRSCQDTATREPSLSTSLIHLL